ncbi:FAD-binding oxidoreductase [Bradyrhizobium sediminis]|uniref:FAD-binding oxidoreductase n=1 Tax=Bradyrhizobium sediminis TaxID=2840469 RepID=A0A975NXD3_9BRAD|nr:FAD-binding oxidoreductase [Bradyrhizobium sediminis]QWG22496.1 FAD-binding oxidoreductase [Bradyrhizobium sediminis]
MPVIDALTGIVGEGGVLDAAEVAKRSAGALRWDSLQAQALVRPRTTEEVSRVLRWCHDHGVAVVTQGGLTGLVHGADAAPAEVILSMERMRAIEDIDPVQRTAVVQAGVVLQTLQEAVEEHGLSFPLDLGARGSATIGGNAATNAGGNRVIRYGMTRDMILGLEAVLADGTVVSSMNHLIKNNTGYDLKQVFIGSEGTLGVITRLVLRLREKPAAQDVAIVAVADFECLPKLLKHMDQNLSGSLSAFEVMWQAFYRLVTSAPAKGKPPVSQDHPYYVLVESLGANARLDSERFVAALESALEARLISDAAVAQSENDRRAFWALRDDVAQVVAGGIPVVFDISLPISTMEQYVAALRGDLQSAIGDHKLWIFGHLGDGNLHVIVQVPLKDYLALRPKIEALVYGPLGKLGGSVSAEHGIGLEKKPYLSVCRNDSELAVMRRLKTALDPAGILNPGKIF